MKRKHLNKAVSMLEFACIFGVLGFISLPIYFFLGFQPWHWLATVFIAALTGAIVGAFLK